jgi:hypothetical protein
VANISHSRTPGRPMAQRRSADCRTNRPAARMRLSAEKPLRETEYARRRREAGTPESEFASRFRLPRKHCPLPSRHDA